MISLRRLPVRVRITVIVMTATTAALFLACGAFIFIDLRSVAQSARRDLDIMAQVVATNSTAALMFGDAEASARILSAVRANPSIVRGAIYTAHGTQFATYGRQPPSTLAYRTGAAASRPDLIETYTPIRDRQEVVGTVYLASDLRMMRQRMKRQLETMAVILGGTLLLALLLAMHLQRAVSQPLLRLAHAARRVRMEKNYSIRVSGAHHTERGEDRDEIRTVIAAFDEMLAEVESRDDAVRRYQAGLEHSVAARTAELRRANGALVEGALELIKAKDTAERLRVHQEMVLNSAGEGIFGLDAGGLVTFVNPSAAGLLGRTVASLLGVSIHKLLHPPDSPESQPGDGLCPACDAAEPSGTTTFARSDGTEIPVEFTAARIDAYGNAGGVVVTFRDITDRRAVERLKDEFLSTVSHEMRTPLTSIRGALALLGTGALATMTPRGQRMIDIAITNSDRLTRLINDVLDLEKLHAGTIGINRRPARIEDLLAQAVEALHPMSERAGVRLVHDSAPAILTVDADRIQQTLANLLGNAIKFSPPDSVVQLSGEIVGDTYVIRVRDHGRGIPADQLEMVFERFHQVDASDSRDRGGTGLGLPICRSIVTAHGGTIAAAMPGNGGGALIVVTLPLPERAVALSSEEETSAA
jgi:PAS domain S-box-containing protein